MRLRIILLVIAISSMVLISFLVPLALVLRTFAADRAVSSATVQAQWMAPLVATLDATSLKLAVAQVNGEDRNQPVTVFLPDGRVLGRPAARSAGVRLAAKGRSFAIQTQGGVEVLVAVQGLPRGTAVIRTFVPGAELRTGVVRAWLLLCAVGGRSGVLGPGQPPGQRRRVAGGLRPGAGVRWPGRGPAGHVHRWLHRARPRHRPAHRRDIRGIADGRTVSHGPGVGDCRPRASGRLRSAGSPPPPARPHLTRGRRATGNAGLPDDPPPWAATVNQGPRRERRLR
jgi:hypothetical protein